MVCQPSSCTRVNETKLLTHKWFRQSPLFSATAHEPRGSAFLSARAWTPTSGGSAA
jgi:hypothetical protein